MGELPGANLGRVGATLHSHKARSPIVILEVLTVQDILAIIQTVGFPIAACVGMFIMLQNEQKAHREESEKLTQTITDLKVTFSGAIADQERSVTEAINNNTLVIQKLLDKLEEK